MKKRLRLVGFLALFAALFSSCNDTGSDTETIAFDVQVTMPSGFKPTVFYADQTVTITKGAQVYTATTDSLGVAHFTGVIPDVYDIATSWALSGDEYVSMADAEVQNNDVLIAGSLLAQTVVSANAITLSTEMSLKQGLLISKVYYAGRKDTLNKNYTADQYIELFNNSDEDICIDSLYFALLEAESTAAFPASANSSYLYAKQVFQIPGTGSQYIVKPGATVLIVNSAINHYATVTTSIDLSGAHFEAKNIKNNNNPNVPGLNLIHTAYSTVTSMNLLTGGDAGIVLFRTGENVSAWPTTFKPGATSGSLFMKIPAKTVVDGVECLKNKATTGPDVATKRLFNYIDAGYKYINATTGYNGEVVARKKASESNGRVYLIDTNNSTNDFLVSATILPGQFLSE